MSKISKKLVAVSHRRSLLVHAIAECTICGKTFQDYLTTHDRAREHARKTGHKVIGEAGYLFEYGN